MKWGDLRSPSRFGFPGGSSAHPGQGGHPAHAASSCMVMDVLLPPRYVLHEHLLQPFHGEGRSGSCWEKPPQAPSPWCSWRLRERPWWAPKHCRKLVQGGPDHSWVPGPPVGSVHFQPTDTMSKKKESTWFLRGESGTPATPYHLRKSLTRLHSLVIQRLTPRSVRYWISGVSILRHSFWCFLLIFFFKL